MTTSPVNVNKLRRLLERAGDGEVIGAIALAAYAIEHADEMLAAIGDARTLARVRRAGARDHANPAAWCRAVSKALDAAP